MKIAKYIADLLFEYECIVIPGFGGLITKEIPAQIHPVQNHFIPPSKEIVFNVHLKTNDGLLVNHIARQENLTYIEARSAVERFVKKCMIELNNGKHIRFRKVGVIFMDEKRNILFEPDKTQNYLAESFGLKSFVSPQINRTVIRPSNKKTKKDRTPKETAKRQQKTKVQGPKYVNINVSFILIVLAIATLIIYKSTTVKQYYNNYASAIPFFYSSPNEYIAHNLDESPMISVLTLVDKLNKPANNNKTKNAAVKKTKPVIKIDNTETPSPSEVKLKSEEVQKQDSVEKEEELEKPTSTIKPEEMPQSASNDQTDDNKFFIIAGVFREKANAERMTNNLKLKGHKAKIVDQTSRGLYRVCFEAFSSMDEAIKQLAIIRKDEESSAWVLSI